MSPMPSPPPRWVLPLNWARSYVMVIEFLGYLAVLGYAGWWVDQRKGWSPWGLFGGLMLGMTFGLYRLVREANRLEK